MEKNFKGKYEYCHIDNDRIVITKTPEIEDLVADYAKSINDFFKTLIVFFISIPIFTALSVMFYYIGNYGLSIYGGGLALFFLLMAFYLILFTSGSPVIYRAKVVKIQFKRTLLFNNIVIEYKDFGRIKKRGILLTNNQVDSALAILLTEKLIEEKNIESDGKKVEIYSFAISLILSVSLFYLLICGNIINVKPGSTAAILIIQGGGFIIMISMAVLTSVIRNLMSSIFYNMKKRK